ncbi:MAG TPA: HD domain-containing protein [Vicinamibacterales bacterium]|nr:HD domain-containing protein [Vicinamibacterales bacterium]
MTHALLRALGFAARKHAGQTRKNAGKTPYLNHVIDVTAVLAIDGGVSDEALLVAAVLHDTVEDTETTLEELAGEFGAEVARLVGEMTDDKSLLKPERKRLQVRMAPSASAGAKQIKIADKICNVRDVADNPAAHWPIERRFDYLDWAAAVVAGCRGVNQRLDDAFDAALARARARLEREAGG